MNTRTWKVTGTRRGVLKTVTVEAATHSDAVRAATYAPHMLVVRDIVLQDANAEAMRQHCIDLRLVTL